MKKQVFLLLPLCSAIMVLPACEKDSENEAANTSEVAVKARADEPADIQPSEEENAGASTLVITDASLSVREAKLEGIQLVGELDFLSELKLELAEPKVLHLIAGGESRTEVMAEGALQNGLYTEIFLDLSAHQSADGDDEMSGKSLLVRGSFDEKAFVYWTDEELEIKLESEEGVRIEGSDEIQLTFHLYRLLQEIDLSLAADGDADGTVEIGPGGVDGNAALYAALSARLESLVSVD